MRLALDDHMIDALSPDRADQPFDNAILPGSAWDLTLLDRCQGD